MLIDGDVMVNVMLFDPEQEEYYTERMTIEEALGFFTEEGRPNPVDRLQGEWIKDDDWCKCSVCGETFDELTNYCPNCGARMKGADDD